MDGLSKIKTTVVGAPIGALAGVIIGYLVSKKIGYDKTFTVLSFATVGLIIGGTIGQSFKK